MKKIKMEQLEKLDIRKTIPYGDDEIVILNLPQHLKEEVLDMIDESMKTEEDIDDKGIVLKVIDKCTNVDFGEADIFSVINPSHELEMIVLEVNLMLQECLDEYLLMLQSYLLAEKNKLTKEDVLEDVKEIEELNKENKDVKKEFKRQRRQVRKDVKIGRK